MKTAVVEEPNVLRVCEVPKPEVDDYHALCKTHMELPAAAPISTSLRAAFRLGLTT